uniref:Leukotriene A4 hydrolaselike protein putative n=1 Tax=Albugo laibachii Nc14 TaxID=890382 RepID=F0W7P8_9STRA|nr:leukotriene A4 hydrolaselike protein putative [Albugo laibachii Nc14]|eukprot:CCA17149.1 leukotriene A4 hydrolaselike protein putative [Albugo laibachii Nc14]
MILENHSFANLRDITYEHLNWTIAIDFSNKKVIGEAEYVITSKEGCLPTHAILDTNHLMIKSVSVDDTKVEFSLGEQSPIFGCGLKVPITATTKRIQIAYETTSLSEGLQWLPKEQTASKTHPYLFTQCQAIFARTLLPCPDTPSCKFTYRATVTVPSWCTAVLSAILDQERTLEEAANIAKENKVFVYYQSIPIPSYLIAIAAGRLESMELGPRSRVWSEANVVGKAAYEFAQTEQFLQHAEAITGQEYVWERYDIVCLPPSFPYGGMENPCMTFVTPTLLAGDRSLAGVVAHEIAHSWTGNLVTNHTWKDFWLNEGWTVWLERKIMTRIYQDPTMYDISAMIGLRSLKRSVEGYGESHPYTHLVPESDNVDPDDVFSSVPYEKGFNFLQYLTNVVGGHEIFERFAKKYIQHFKFKTIASLDFKAFFIDYFSRIEKRQEAIREVDWTKWFYSPGMPPVQPNFDSTKTNEAIALGNAMSEGMKERNLVVSSEAISSWPNALLILLLDTILLSQSEDKSLTFTPNHLDAIDTYVNNLFSTSKNSELRFRWYTIALRAHDFRPIQNVVQFLQEQGRMKFVRPLFRDLTESMGTEYAIQLFNKVRDMYHPIAVKMIQKDLDESHYQTTSQ